MTGSVRHCPASPSPRTPSSTRSAPTRTPPSRCCAPCGKTPPMRSTRSGGWSTACGHPRSTSWGWCRASPAGRGAAPRGRHAAACPLRDPRAARRAARGRRGGGVPHHRRGAHQRGPARGGSSRPGRAHAHRPRARGQHRRRRHVARRVAGRRAPPRCANGRPRSAGVSSGVRRRPAAGCSHGSRWSLRGPDAGTHPRPHGSSSQCRASRPSRALTSRAWPCSATAG